MGGGRVVRQCSRGGGLPSSSARPSLSRPLAAVATGGWPWVWWVWAWTMSGRLKATLAHAPAWEQLILAENYGPAARAWHAAELWGGDTLVVFGGEGEGGVGGVDAEESGASGAPLNSLLGDLWALNLTLAFGDDDEQSGEDAGWELLHGGADWLDVDADPEAAPVAPSGRFGVASAVAVTPAGGEAYAGGVEAAFLVFGGLRMEWPDHRNEGPSYALSDELWAFDLAGDLGWQQMPAWADGMGPTPRYGATGSFYDGSFLVLGGNNSTEVFGELWSYSLTTQTWTALSSFFEPWLARFGHGSALVPGDVITVGDNSWRWSDVLVFFGGSLDDTIHEDPATGSGGAIELAAFGENGGAGAGASSSDRLALLANLDLSPSLPRYGHSMVADSRGMLWVHGGMLPDAETLSDRTLVMYVGSEDVFNADAESEPALRRRRKSRSRRRSLRASPAAPAARRAQDGGGWAAALDSESAASRSEAVRGEDGGGSKGSAPEAAAFTTAGLVSQGWGAREGEGSVGAGGGAARRELSSSSTADVDSADEIVLGTTSLSRNWREYVPPDAGDGEGGEGDSSENESVNGPGARMHHRAVVWRGRLIVHGGRLSVLQGDVSSDMWSLAIEPGDGLAGADTCDDSGADGCGDGSGGGVASEYLILAESDAAGDDPPLSAVGWTASGVVVLVFVGAVVAWMLKHVLSCALHKLRTRDGEGGGGAEGRGDDSGSAAGGAGGSGVFGAAGLHGAGFVTAASVAPTTIGVAATARDGLSPSEIALLPVRRFVGPCPASSAPKESKTAAASSSSSSSSPEKGSAARGGSRSQHAAAGRAAATGTRAPISGSSEPRRQGRSGDGGGDREGLGLAVSAGSDEDEEEEEEEGVQVVRPRAAQRKQRLRRGMQSSSVSEATTAVSPSSSLSVPFTNPSTAAAAEAAVVESTTAGAALRNATGGEGRRTRRICLTGYVENCSLRVLLPCEHVFHCSCVDEWLTRQGVCPICKCVVTVSAGSRGTAAAPAAEVDRFAAAAVAAGNFNSSSDDGNAPPPRITRPRLAPIVPVDLARAMAALLTPRAPSAGVVVTGTDSVGNFSGGGGGGTGSRLSAPPQSVSLDSSHGARTAMRAMTAATGGGSGSGSSLGVDSRILHRVAVTATPTGSSSGGGGIGGGRAGGLRNNRNRDARRMSRGFTSAGDGGGGGVSEVRGERGVPAPSAGGRAGGRAGGDRGGAVRVWESATGDEESDDSSSDGGDEMVTVTHYENPLFSHRMAVVGGREARYR
eukprot:g16565.t1